MTTSTADPVKNPVRSEGISKHRVARVRIGWVPQTADHRIQRCAKKQSNQHQHDFQCALSNHDVLLLAPQFLLRDPQDVILYLDLVSRELRFNLLLELRHRRRAVLAVEAPRVVHQNHVLIS